MSDEHEQPAPESAHEAETAREAAAEAERRRRGRDRRSLIDLTRAERGEPERRRLPGVDRRGTDAVPEAEAPREEPRGQGEDRSA
ncbi:hypothetical protein GTQ99_04355 [Kineococcus sp. T13]|uniref:hypothetical protein n=1 Tax=Kineococcus vitellinus TaxID=2696565 RepID=UPI0014129C64|nr:hypothetical protein [Kineococcus vitellinus]NAZ74657.1 hypothetical protein [Kineococcus vitellinus]